LKKRRKTEEKEKETKKNQGQKGEIKKKDLGKESSAECNVH